MIEKILFLAAPCLHGYCLVSLLWNQKQKGFAEFLFALCLGAGIGYGISTLLFFLRMEVFPGFPLQSLFWVESIFAFVLTVFFLFKWPRMSASPIPKTPFSLSSFLLPLAFILILASSALILFSSLRIAPHGDMDAWAIWNMRARFLFRAGADWPLGLLQSFPNGDYPLLLPLAITRCWFILGFESLSAPHLIAAVFSLITLGLLVSSVWLLRGMRFGLLAGIALLGIPFFIQSAANQYADIPISFFYLASLALFCLAQKEPQSWRISALTGLSLGLACWTKNEGFLFLFIFLSISAKTLFSSRSKAVAFGLGVLPALSVVFYFKKYLAPPNSLFFLQTIPSMTGRMLSPSRYGEILGEIFRLPIDLWMVFSLIALIAAYFVVRGKQEQATVGCLSNALFLILGLMLTGFFFIYVTTPYLTFYIQISFPRLLLQLCPGLLFAYFLKIKLFPASSPNKT